MADDFNPKAYLAEKRQAQAIGQIENHDVKDAEEERFDPKAYIASKAKAESDYPSAGFLHPLPKSGYADIPEDELTWYQKGEKWLQDHGGVKPGQEMFTPPALAENKSKGLPAAAGLLAAGGGAAYAGTEGLLGALKYAGKRAFDFSLLKQIWGH